MITRDDIARAYAVHRAELVRSYAARAGADAEDIVQEAFLSLLRSARRLSDPEHLGPLLGVIVRNACLSRRRRQPGPDSALFELELPSVHGQVAARESLGQISVALGATSRAAREAFRLVTLEELTDAAAAKRLGISTTAARRDLARARQAIDNAGVQPDAGASR